jgi:hypothetical protein
MDTARTVAQIKALLADNATGAISPQDVRDLVESIVDPVAGGGFDRPNLDADMLFILRDVSGATQLSRLYELNYPASSFALQSSCINGKSYISELQLSAWAGTETTRTLFDPSGWIRASSYVSSWWSGTFPAYTILELPPGRYRWFARLIYALVAGGAPATTDAWFISLGDVDDPGALGGDEVSYAGNIVIPTAFAASSSFPGLMSGGKAESVFSGDLVTFANDGIRRFVPVMQASLAAPVHLETMHLQIARFA